MNSRNSAVEKLVARQSIIDTLYIALEGFDHHNASVLPTTFTNDAIMEIQYPNAPPRTSSGLDSIRKTILDFLGPKTSTHMVTNVLVEFKSDTEAELRSYVLAQHIEAGKGMDVDGGHYLVGSEYVIDFVKTAEAAWKIKNFIVKFVWRRGDASIMARD